MKQIPFLWSIVALLCIASCSQKNHTEQNKVFQVITPLVQDTAYVIEYTASISALQNVEIRARLSGFIEGIFVDEGQTVSKGQLLFTINNLEYQQELRKAKAATKSAIAELKTAEIEWENTKKLLDKNIIGKPEFDLISAKVDMLNAKVDEATAAEAQAKLKLDLTEIRAPFTGTINRIPNKVGSLIDDGSLLTSLSNATEVYAYYSVSENAYLDFTSLTPKSKTIPVELVLSNGALYEHLGIIETIENEFDRSTGNIAFRARFPNPENILRHGASGKVLVKTKLDNALLIPQKSTFEIQGNTYVFIVDKMGIVKMRKVVPKYRLSQLYVIKEGLTAGDQIVYEGIQKLKDGDKVTAEILAFSNINKW